MACVCECGIVSACAIAQELERVLEVCATYVFIGAIDAEGSAGWRTHHIDKLNFGIAVLQKNAATGVEIGEVYLCIYENIFAAIACGDVFAKSFAHTVIICHESE